MKYHQTPHKKTKDKKSYITKIREEEQKKMDRLKKTNDKKTEDDSGKVDDNSEWLKKVSGDGVRWRVFCLWDDG